MEIFIITEWGYEENEIVKAFVGLEKAEKFFADLVTNKHLDFVEHNPNDGDIKYAYMTSKKRAELDGDAAPPDYIEDERFGNGFSLKILEVEE